MEPFQHFQEDFEQFILHKEFHQLSAEELTILDAEGLGEEEYNSIRQTLISLTFLDEEQEQPKVILKQKLLDVFDQGAQVNGRIIRWPLWTGIALSFAAMIVMGVFIFNPNNDRFETHKQVAQELKPGADSNVNRESDLIFTPPQIEVTTGVASDANGVDASVAESSVISKMPSEVPMEESIVPLAESDHAKDVSEPVRVVASEMNSSATLSNSSPIELNTTNSTTSYTWDSVVLSKTVLNEKANSSKRKKEAKGQAQMTYSLAEFPQFLNNTVTVY